MVLTSEDEYWHRINQQAIMQTGKADVILVNFTRSENHTGENHNGITRMNISTRSRSGDAYGHGCNTCKRRKERCHNNFLQLGIHNKPITFVIKGAVAFAAGVLYQKVGKTSKSSYCTKNYREC